MSYRDERRLRKEKSMLIYGIVIPLAIALAVTICELAKKDSYDAGYQACIEEYNLYSPYE